MQKIKNGYGCGIKATMLTPADALCDLRSARHISAVLVLPNGETMPCDDLSFDHVTQAVYIRLLPDRELTSNGIYGIVFNVKSTDTTYSSSLLYFAEVSNDAVAGYRELHMTIFLTVVDYPSNPNFKGVSPRISDNGTWLVYDDTNKMFIDTGVVARSVYIEDIVNNAITATEAATAAAQRAEKIADELGAELDTYLKKSDQLIISCGNSEI